MSHHPSRRGPIAPLPPVKPALPPLYPPFLATPDAKLARGQSLCELAAEFFEAAGVPRAADLARQAGRLAEMARFQEREEDKATVPTMTAAKEV